jgi:hypothetical protein
MRTCKRSSSPSSSTSTTRASSSRRARSPKYLPLSPTPPLPLIPQQFLNMHLPKVFSTIEEAADTYMYEEHKAAARRQIARKESSLRRARCAARGRDLVEDRWPQRGEGRAAELANFAKGQPGSRRAASARRARCTAHRTRRARGEAHAAVNAAHDVVSAASANCEEPPAVAPRARPLRKSGWSDEQEMGMQRARDEAAQEPLRLRDVCPFFTRHVHCTL